MSNMGSYEESVKDFTWDVSKAELGCKEWGEEIGDTSTLEHDE